jgi:hypothetical protein
MAKTAADRELEAIATILSALNNLDGESIQRVFDYIFNRLSIASPSRIAPSSPQTGQTLQSIEPHRGRRPSIRDLKDEKQPDSANQMAALVAYYLSEEADEESRKQTLTTSDLEKYFKQAGFKLPQSLEKTLANATSAGYFDSIGNGQYKLNAVGYNLVAHNLPRGRGNSAGRSAVKKRRPTRRKRKP